VVEACNRPQTNFCSEKAGSYDIYSVTTGEEAKPVSSNGGTTAKYLPNAVSFGPGMPGEKYMGHTANEFKKLSNLLLDTQMFSEMMLRADVFRNDVAYWQSGNAVGSLWN